jgi:hypothetical protein
MYIDSWQLDIERERKTIEKEWERRKIGRGEKERGREKYIYIEKEIEEKRREEKREGERVKEKRRERGESEREEKIRERGRGWKRREERGERVKGKRR